MTQLVQSQTQQPTTVIPNLLEKVFTPPMIAACGLLALLIVLGPILNNLHRNQKITTGKWAGRAEKANARKVGIKQMRNRNIKEVALYIGDPASPDCLWLPWANSGIGIFGATGMGKSHSGYNPLLRSSIEQGQRIMLFDPSGELAEIHVPQALEEGYKVHFFAPGEDYSGTINFLDFMLDPSDSEMAEEIGHVLRLNSTDHGSKGDPYFGPATDKTSKTVLLMAKDSPYPDIPMAFSLLRLPDFAQRLKDSTDVDIWAQVAATTAMAAADSPRTVAGFLSGVANMYETFVSARNLPCITGKSTIPLDLPEKTMVVFQYDQQRKAACAPLVATAIHLMVKRNIGTHNKHQVPLFLSLDEFATSIYLPEVVNWVNFARKYGLVSALGIQTKSQAVSLYGQETTKAMLAGLNTRLMFNPNDLDTAEEISKMLGEQEVMLWSNSTSWSSQGHSRGSNEQIHKKPLLTATEIRLIPSGGAVVFSPGCANRKEAGLPLYVPQIKIPKIQIDRNIASQKLWRSRMKKDYTERIMAIKKKLEPLSPKDVLLTRYSAAELILPPSPLQPVLSTP
jgi:type IV secretion system protein VirD4